ncbi:MAG: SAM-dependent chlorinase/fluorinase [Prevotellaceae bacterium]|jgi:S-adenosylmethionine hydrolase|nr:SAM-dependent chlorinase/fluorinase [Prevotellaceae bacterium]
MLIITLTTDWKDGDYNIGRLKACIISRCEDVCIIDITHNIQPHNTLPAAFVLKNTYRHFPSGSIHIVGVNSEPSPKNQIAVMKNDEHFFIGANDGMLSLICEKQPDSIVALPYNDNCQAFRFLEVLGNCVKAISDGIELKELGDECELRQEFTSIASCYESRIVGRVIYIDTFGNAITNIDKKTFEKIGKNRKFEIIVQNNLIKITELSQYYDNVKSGKILAIFNSVELLELAINQGNIARINSLDTKSSIIINFID